MGTLLNQYLFRQNVSAIMLQISFRCSAGVPTADSDVIIGLGRLTEHDNNFKGRGSVCSRHGSDGKKANEKQEQSVDK